MTAYPSAKIILTHRPAESWVKSMQSSIWRYHSWKSWDLLGNFQPTIYWWQKLDRLDWDCWFNTSWRADKERTEGNTMEADRSRVSILPRHPRSAYHSVEFTECSLKNVDEWNEYVRDLVRSQGREADMLELPVGSGWEPLCQFLRCDVPRNERGEKQGYPRVWSGDEMRTVAWQTWAVGVACTIGSVMVPASAVIAAVLWYWYRK